MPFPVYSRNLFAGSLSGAGDILFTVPAGQVWKVKWASAFFGYPTIGFNLIQLLPSGSSAGASIVLSGGNVQGALNPFGQQANYEKPFDSLFADLTLTGPADLAWFQSDHSAYPGVTVDGYIFTS